METRPRELLLTDARDRYKAESDRYGQAFTRAGIYLGVVAVYISAMARFLDKPPSTAADCHFSHGVFLFSAGVLILTIVVCVLCVSIALVGREVGYAVRPSEWRKFVEGSLTAYYRDPFFIDNPVADVGQAMHDDVQERMLEQLCGAVDQNIEQNRRRFRWLFLTSLALLVGLIALVISATAYGYLMTKAPSVASPIRVVDPVDVRVHDSR